MSDVQPSAADDVADLEEAGAGRFSSAGRSAAIAAALPLLATYFADAQTWDLETTAQLGTETDPVLDELAAGARLRASLAAADRLLEILAGVTARPTFRYTQTAAESVGTIRGRLDLGRYSRQNGRITVPRRYPIRLVERETATPENILAAYATLWIKRDLASADRSVLPPRAPEARELDRLDQALRRNLGLPLLAGTAPHAHQIWRRGDLPQLLDQVERRLIAGHIAQPEPYRQLHNWITRVTNGAPVADLGDREWSFYDERFDTKLFEIWCLQGLAQAITRQVGDPARATRSLADRRRGALYSWSIGIGTLNLYFQPALRTLSGDSVRWSYDTGKPFAGFPDLAVTADTVVRRGLALFDPKLRQRRNAPTEELYKLLGYFANLPTSMEPTGAILYYSPGTPKRYRLTTRGGGELHALGFDPAKSNEELFDRAAAVALRSAGLDEHAQQQLAAVRSGEEGERLEHLAAVRQSVAVRTLQQAAEALPAGTLAPTRKQIATALRSTWDLLSQEAQTMVTTAEYFANIAPDDADHSGPLLGVAAAFELLLNEHIVRPAADSSEGKVSSSRTLGQSLHAIERALRGRLDDETDIIRVTIAQRGINAALLLPVIAAARSMNRLYRIPAAHAELVSLTKWADGREMLLNSGTGLIPSFARALPS